MTSFSALRPARLTTCGCSGHKDWISENWVPKQGAAPRPSSVERKDIGPFTLHYIPLPRVGPFTLQPCTQCTQCMHMHAGLQVAAKGWWPSMVGRGMPSTMGRVGQIRLWQAQATVFPIGLCIRHVYCINTAKNTPTPTMGARRLAQPHPPCVPPCPRA